MTPTLFLVFEYEAATRLVLVDPLQFAGFVSMDVLGVHQLEDAVHGPSSTGESVSVGCRLWMQWLVLP